MDVYENNGYHRVFNNFGMGSLSRGINIPDAALGIGFAENLASVPLVLPNFAGQKDPYVSEITTITETKPKLQGNPINKDTFTFSPYYGDVIGGF